MAVKNLCFIVLLMGSSKNSLNALKQFPHFLFFVTCKYGNGSFHVIKKINHTYIVQIACLYAIKCNQNEAYFTLINAPTRGKGFHKGARLCVWHFKAMTNLSRRCYPSFVFKLSPNDYGRPLRHYI